MKARRGQVALYLVMVLVALCILAVMNAEVFVAVRARNRVQNAGDAAALAAARRQAELLNEIGRLNLEHLRAAATGDRLACEEIPLRQRRLALLGPIAGLRDADRAARENGMEPNEEFAKILGEHVGTILTTYANGTNADGEPYPEPWPGAWREYAQELSAAVSGGLAVGPDNCEFYDARGGHLLLTPEFYYAIAGRDWCWFKFNALSTLENYDGYRYWGGLPAAEDNTCDNCEVFSLHVKAFRGTIMDRFPKYEQLADLLNRYGGGEFTAAQLEKAYLLKDEEQVWFFYEEAEWRRWEEIDPMGEDSFPVVGAVLPKYDVRGSATICRCKYDNFVWSAAAKPFGSLETAEGESTVNAANGFVLPAFEAVRLVPLDAVGGSELMTADYDWITHVRKHLEVYLVSGPRSIDCFYCRELVEWEMPLFRETGRSWLKRYGGECRRLTGGRRGHGGTSHGH